MSDDNAHQMTEDWPQNAAQVRRAITPCMEDTIFPIPLRAGVTVRIQGLPANLTAAEATKIAAVVMAYAQKSDG